LKNTARFVQFLFRSISTNAHKQFMIVTLCRLCMLTLGCLALPMTANADLKLPCTPDLWFKQSNAIAQSKFPDLSKQIALTVQGTAFQIPHGYLGSRFKPTSLDPYIDHDGTISHRVKFDLSKLRFILWMPNAVRPDLARYHTIFRKCSDPNDHLVRVTIENPFLGSSIFDARWPAEGQQPHSEGTYVSPNQKWENTIGRQIHQQQRALSEPKAVFEELAQYANEKDEDPAALLERIREPMVHTTAHGLRHSFRVSHLSKKNASLMYRQSKDDLRQIYISCFTDAWRGTYPTCRGDIYWPEVGLGLRIVFLKDQLPHWDAMVEQIHGLVLGWRQ
jgi:hypothetical protein